MMITTQHLALDLTYQGLTRDQLQQFANERLPRDFAEQRSQLLNGTYENPSEGRQVTHVLNRSRHSVVAANGGRNRFSEIVRTLRSGKWLGATGQVITDVINVGVGGSDLGPLLGSEALQEFADDNTAHPLKVHFASSMDGSQLYTLLPQLNPATTLVIMASKSFSTIDTLANIRTLKAWAARELSEQQWLEKHVIGVSSNIEGMTNFGIPPAQQLSFAESVGGRYSLWSAIGLPIALTVGANQFARMLDGAKAMDAHFGEAELHENIPLLMALTGVYNREQRGINNLAVLPYDGRLRKLPDYLQQLDMESNGKQQDRNGKPIDYPTGPIIWGGFGPNGQHAFYQHLHQGYDNFAADFVLVLQRAATEFDAATQAEFAEQQTLSVANCLAHRRLMWFGDGKTYPGQHPSNLLLLQELTPQAFGALIAAYEHKVFTQGVIWKINSFDQPGVELGKKIANEVLEVIKTGTGSDAFDDSTQAILQRL